MSEHRTYNGPDCRYAVKWDGFSRAAGPFTCPSPSHRDSKPSYHVFPDGGYCFGCGYREDPAQLLERVGRSPGDLPRARKVAPRVLGRSAGAHEARLFAATAHRILQDRVSPFHDRLEWLRDRGLSERAIERWKLGYWPDEYVIPVWNEGEITGVKFRRDEDVCDDDAPKYRIPPGQPGQPFRPNPGSGPKVVTEGELDALLVAQYGFDAVTATTGSQGIPRVLVNERLNYGKVYVCADNDDAGDQMLVTLAGLWRGPVYRVNFWGKDISEALLAYPERDRRSMLKLWIQYARQV